MWRRCWGAGVSNALTIRNSEELLGIVRAGSVVRSALDVMRKAVSAGMTTKALDDLCAGEFERWGARSGPQLAYGFPGVSCISINEEAVHGIPSTARTIRDGDLVKLDVVAELDGFYADAAITVPVGNASQRRQKLAGCAQSALRDALKVARAGRPISGIGRAVQSEVERQGFSVMPELGGHGVGRAVHEEPFVPNYDDRLNRQVLWTGLVIAVEPVISSGAGGSVTSDDWWTIRTADGSPSAHFEHTIVITRGDPIVVT